MSRKTNWKLKRKIAEKYRFQADFVHENSIVGGETFVSKVITGSRELPPEKQKQWARWLDCRVEEIFS